MPGGVTNLRGQIRIFLHDSLDAATVTLVAFRQVGERLQLGFLLVVEHLRIPEFLIFSRKFVTHPGKPFLHQFLLLRQFLDRACDRLKFSMS